MGNCLKSIADLKMVMGQHDDALALLSEAYLIFKQLEYALHNMVDCVKSMSKICTNHGLYGDTFTSLSGAWAAVVEPQLWRQHDIVGAFGVLLDVWRRSNNPTSTSAEPDELSEVLNETRGMVDNLCHIGNIRRDERLYKEAMESFGDAHRLLKGLESGWGYVECLRGLVTVLEKQGDQVKHIQSLVRLARALGPIDIPQPGGHGYIEEGYVVVLRAGGLLGSLGDHVEVPRQLRIEVVQLHVRVAIAFHARLRHEEARSTLLGAGQFLQRSGEELHVMGNLMRLEDELLQADYTREALAVLEEQERVKLEPFTEIQWSDWLEDDRRRAGWW
ncbi:hypothetical protein FRB94_006083 [Tulasnella sp. JGI-2019a]|nr:hypothetical protein FRB93_013236 [Tulasnella sp. JGI-2019a]KAG8999571.1 hypothetical protein FRB94_006083 [Tulasnella sp. JGI-2019a]